MTNPRDTFASPSRQSLAKARRVRRQHLSAGRPIEEEEGPAETDEAGSEERTPQREGLPPDFRMRHDAHYVDELLSRGRGHRVVAIPARENGDERRSPWTDAAPAAPPTRVYAEVVESLEAIGTCLQLFRDTARPAAERVALDLIETETARAAWLVQALSVLDEEPPVANGAVELEAVANRVARLLAPGRYRAGAALRIETSAPGLRARGDESLLTLAVAAIATALQAATERTAEAVVRIQTRTRLAAAYGLERCRKPCGCPRRGAPASSTPSGSIGPADGASQSAWRRPAASPNSTAARSRWAAPSTAAAASSSRCPAAEQGRPVRRG